MDFPHFKLGSLSVWLLGFLHKYFCFQLQSWDKAFCLSLMLHLKYWRTIQFLTASCPCNKSTILLSINFIIFYFRTLKEDVRIGLLAGWRKGVEEVRCFMKDNSVLLINYLFIIYLIRLIPIFNFFLSYLQSLLFCNFLWFFPHHRSQDHNHFLWRY